jgi:hypothetical protein
MNIAIVGEDMKRIEKKMGKIINTKNFSEKKVVF